MDFLDVTLNYVKYKINRLTITIPGITDPHVVESQNILNMIIEKDYENFMYPFFEIDVALPNYIYRAMKKNNQNLRAFVDIKYGGFKDPNYITGDKPAFGTYVNDNFYIFMEEMSPELLESTLERREKENDTYNTGGMELGDMEVIKLLLYKEDYLFKAKTVVNAVLSSVTLVDALTYVLNSAGLCKILLSPPNNYKKYNEFVITPISAIEQINRICNDYGIHNNGSLIFLDFNNIYILDKTAKCTAFVNNEYKTTYLAACPKLSQGSLMTRGGYSNSVEKYSLLNMDIGTFVVKTLSGINEQIYGNDFININSKSGDITTVITSASKSIGSLTTPTRVTVSNTGDNTTNALKHKMEEDSKIISAGFSYVNLNAFNPNKEFILSIDDVRFNKYCGKYRITKKVALFVKEGDYFIPHVTAEFKGK